MSRKIKFRVWDNNTKSFIDDLSNFWISPSFNNVFMQWRPEWDGVLPFEFGTDEFEFQQFTGFTDKNDVDIYEGDLVTVDYGSWIMEKGNIQYNKPEFNIMQNNLPYNMYGYEKIKVIGNILENKEKEKEKEI